MTKRKNNTLSAQEKREIKDLYAINPKYYTKYRLAVMYSVSWGTIHYTIDEDARLKNNELNKARNKRNRKAE